MSTLIVIVTLFAVALDVNVVSAVIVCLLPFVIVVEPFFTTKSRYPALAVPVGYTGVSFNTYIPLVTFAPLVVSAFAVNVVPVPAVNVTLKFVIVALFGDIFPFASCTHTYHVSLALVLVSLVVVVAHPLVLAVGADVCVLLIKYFDPAVALTVNVL